MKSIEQSVARHYTHGSLEDEILRALTSAGKDINRLETADLAPVDEFHIGGRQTTIDFAGHLGASRGMHLLDIGCGLGGASRYFAHALDCRVSGIDLTEEYVGSPEAWRGGWGSATGSLIAQEARFRSPLHPVLSTAPTCSMSA
jgi:2-polyprenyl-3-methyl-5-hydroxy-6-metoxy-1,4-benzoquinol methylase